MMLGLFQCDQCTAAFEYREELRQHYTERHSGAASPSGEAPPATNTVTCRCTAAVESSKACPIHGLPRSTTLTTDSTWPTVVGGEAPSPATPTRTDTALAERSARTTSQPVANAACRGPSPLPQQARLEEPTDATRLERVRLRLPHAP